MDHNKWTPIKNKINCDNLLMLSPITRTPVRKNDMKLKTSFQNSTGNFSLLPNHVTPPSGLTKFIARNPFEADLTNKLHISVISPSVFNKVTSPAQRGSPSFSWSIDEIALMQPAKIDEFPVQQMHCSDPEIEKTAQEAISRFFSENQIIPSPYDVRRIENKVNILKTPVRVLADVNTSKESQKSKVEKKENWTQTALSLPPQLPPNVEEALKPYFNFTQDQNCDYEEANSSNTSLRRKLFTNHNDSHNDSSSSISLSPVEPSSPVHHNWSPAQSGMFCHGTPLKNCSQIVQRTFGTPLAYSLNSSPCNVSPIDNPGLSMSCQSIKSRNRSVARLDFTKDMSVDLAMDDDKGCDTNSKAKELCKTLFPDEIIADAESDISHCYTDDEKYCEATQMVISTETSTKLVCDNLSII